MRGIIAVLPLVSVCTPDVDVPAVLTTIAATAVGHGGDGVADFVAVRVGDAVAVVAAGDGVVCSPRRASTNSCRRVGGGRRG